MNLVVLIGRLTRDPELKFGQSGKAYSRFSLAVDRPFSKGEADFINCVAFGKTAELIGEYLRKGRKVAVNGRLQMNRYEVNGEKEQVMTYLLKAWNLLKEEEKHLHHLILLQRHLIQHLKLLSNLLMMTLVDHLFDEDEFPF